MSRLLWLPLALASALIAAAPVAVALGASAHLDDLTGVVLALLVLWFALLARDERSSW
jgi:hypothetical protein